MATVRAVGLDVQRQRQQQQQQQQQQSLSVCNVIGRMADRRRCFYLAGVLLGVVPELEGVLLPPLGVVVEVQLRVARHH